MDNNKLDKLRDIRYTVRKCCGTCNNACFEFRAEWGTCKIHEYIHKKHTGKPRHLSIHMYGSCGSYDMNNVFEAVTEHYKEFYE
jgi:hypothetical protein